MKVRPKEEIGEGPVLGEAGLGAQPRQCLGRYEIQKEIGRGMMGIVYEAVDPALGRIVALKAIELGFTLSREERETFERRFIVEARIAALLSHPNIMVIHDVGRDEPSGTLFMALEYLQGRTLAEVIRRGPLLDWRDALRIVAQLAEGLDHAHRAGVIHRDVKPGNIMLLPTGQPKIMDFGIAKIEAASTQLTIAGQTFGTPLYMSPEQALGEAMDRTTDIFSLGSVAYSLVAGRPAFWAESIPRVVTLVSQDNPLPLSQVAPGLPARVGQVIARAMARKPSERYGSGRELAEDIEGLLDLEHLLESHAPRRGSAVLTRAGDDRRVATVGGPTGLAAEGSTEPILPRTPAKTQPTMTLRRADPQKRLAWGLGLLLAAGAAWSLTHRPGVNSETAAADAAELERPPRSSPSSTPAAPEPDHARVAKAWPTRTAVESARLAVTLEHSIKQGLVRVRVDGELVGEARLDSEAARTIEAFKFRGGDVREFSVPSGEHDVEVQVLWDGKEKTSRIAGHFDAPSTRRLRARLGGLIKKLSLEWASPT